MVFKTLPDGYNFIEMERKWLEHWYKGDTVKKYLTKNDKSKTRFSFFDGPITANNPMGVHHGWGRTYKDLWQKFNNLLGHKQRFQNGFDCQGLWVEVEVEKELKTKTKKDIENLVPGDRNASIAKFVDLCKQRVYKFSAIQTDQSKRLGYFMDWDHSYFTMSDENNYMIWYFLKQCYENGWIYKGRDSVPWCPRCETAISQHEMLTEDYKELTHETIFFKLPITTKGWERTSLVAWTTTPWTVPANVALGVNIKFTYGVYENSKKERLIFIVSDEVGNVPTRTLKGKEMPITDYILKDVENGHEFKQVKTISGSELLGLKYVAPFDYLDIVKKAEKENPKTFHTVVDGSEIVTSGEGTGILHVAPGAGQEDFTLGKKEDLPIIEVILDNADYREGMGEFSGKNAKKHPELIIDELKQLDSGKYLLKTLMYTHRYPACWRCKTELVWKVADEWYIAMDKPTPKSANAKSVGKTLRDRMIATAKKINWIPDFGLERELDWLKNMHDWLISKKNRYWGLALPIYECKKCGTFEVLGTKDELEKRAVSGWDQFVGHSPHKPYIDDVLIKCSHCNETVKRVDDVGNPWLDAGIIPFSTLIDPKTGQLSYLGDKKYFNEWFPANFITESFPGQFKNWFYALIAMASVLEDNNPTQTILGFATCVGEDGRPMHKSWGNSIEFNEGAEKIGADVMRWMYSRQNYAENLPFGYKKADDVRRQFYLILWNSYKYFVEYANLESKSVKLEKKVEWVDSDNILDIWLQTRFVQTRNNVKKYLSEQNSKNAAAEIESLVSDLSTWYIRRSRNRIFVHSEDHADKKHFYQTLYSVLVNLTIIMSPFLPYITEEIYTNLTEKASVHLEMWPEMKGEYPNEKLVSDMQQIRELLESGHRVRKELKLKVRQPLASVKVTLPENKKFLLTDNQTAYESLIKDELNVKSVVIVYETRADIDISYDITMTPELEQEGAMRELVRKIQAERKTLGIKLHDQISLVIPAEFAPFEDYIKKTVLANKVNIGTELKVN